MEQHPGNVSRPPWVHNTPDPHTHPVMLLCQDVVITMLIGTWEGVWRGERKLNEARERGEVKRKGLGKERPVEGMGSE